MTPLKVYGQHKIDCKALVWPCNTERMPWAVPPELRALHPSAYGKYECTCGFEAALAEEDKANAIRQ